MALLPYLVVIGVVTFALLVVWVACVWLPEIVRREKFDPLDDPESIDACATTGRFTRLDVDDD